MGRGRYVPALNVRDQNPVATKLTNQTMSVVPSHRFDMFKISSAVSCAAKQRKPFSKNCLYGMNEL
jgi:hypothetical protein